MRPDFFIVGAPKSGTTSLYTYLKAHPQIFMPTLKEPAYFGTDLNPPERFKTQDAYLGLFAEARSDQRVGEASTRYFFSQRAAVEIKQFNPQASIIIMLRNPVDMVYAYHSQKVLDGHEHIFDFQAALAAEPQRKLRGRPMRADIAPAHLYYRDIGKLSRHVKRYLDTFGKERVLVILFNDFVSRTEHTYRQTLTFLGVSENFTPDFEARQRNRVIRHRWLHLAVRNPPLPLKRLARAILPHSFRLMVNRLLWRYNTHVSKRAPLSPEVRQVLEQEFKNDLAALSDLLERDLTDWCNWGR